MGFHGVEPLVTSQEFKGLRRFFTVSVHFAQLSDNYTRRHIYM